MAQTIAESLVKEGLAKGREEGRILGQLVTYRHLIQVVLQKKFGSLPPTLTERIESIADPTRLNDLFEQATRAERLDDLQF